MIFSLLPWWLVVLVTVALSAGAGLLCRSWLSRTLSKETLRKAHEVSSTAYLNTGVLYGIVLGLVTVNGLERHVDLNHAIEKEASALLAIARITTMFSSDEATAIKHSVRTYAEHVVSKEWDDDARTLMHSESSLDSMWRTLTVLVQRDSSVSVVEQLLVDKFDVLQQARMERLGLMSEKINTMMWVILVSGGLFMILFLVAFDPLSLAVHAVLFASVAATIASILILIYSFDHPAEGALNIEPTQYQEVVRTLVGQP